MMETLNPLMLVAYLALMVVFWESFNAFKMTLFAVAAKDGVQYQLNRVLCALFMPLVVLGLVATAVDSFASPTPTSLQYQSCKPINLSKNDLYPNLKNRTPKEIRNCKRYRWATKRDN